MLLVFIHKNYRYGKQTGTVSSKVRECSHFAQVPRCIYRPLFASVALETRTQNDQVESPYDTRVGGLSNNTIFPHYSLTCAFWQTALFNNHSLGLLKDKTRWTHRHRISNYLLLCSLDHHQRHNHNSTRFRRSQRLRKSRMPMHHRPLNSFYCSLPPHLRFFKVLLRWPRWWHRMLRQPAPAVPRLLPKDSALLFLSKFYSNTWTV